MRFWIGVENFAKIESARVCINNYTLFVGPNNSGKTFLMQLIQGLSDKITRLLDEDVMDIVLAEKIEGYSKYLINKDNIVQFTECINKKLHLKKEQIIEDIFKKTIPIEKLYIDVELENNSFYKIDITDNKCLENEKIRKLFGQQLFSYGSLKNIDKLINIGVLSEVKEQKENALVASTHLSPAKDTKKFIFRDMLRNIFEKSSLFLPASRTGLMLLYRDFFANKTDDAISYRVAENRLVQDNGQYNGLTQPVYDFLRFLQTYSEDEKKYETYKNELSFFEDKIIDGHINTNKYGNFSYNPKNDYNNIIPMYLASAMVNEVTPLVLALTSETRYERLIIDEVEASLHPEKQLELVRFLNRLNNAGINIILSTHSDTFVSKLNNLYVLSEYIKENSNNEIEKYFHLEKEDLIKSENLFVYEFIFQPNGKSIVKEIIPDSRTGFQFGLFTKSAMELYNEALRLGEINVNV